MNGNGNVYITKAFNKREGREKVLPSMTNLNLHFLPVGMQPCHPPTSNKKPKNIYLKT